jgi:hypothetical protein
MARVTFDTNIFISRKRVELPKSFYLSKVINALQRGLKSQQGGLTPKMSTDQKHRIIHDVLIARTAKRAGIAVVTDNLKDFEAIQRFCKVRLIGGDEYFSA